MESTILYKLEKRIYTVYVYFDKNKYSESKHVNSPTLC